jgi:hypothetical protein
MDYFSKVPGAVAFCLQSLDLTQNHLRRVCHLNPPLPVLYVSGDSGAEWSANGVPNSLRLQKPSAIAQLVAAVTTLLNQAQQRRLRRRLQALLLSPELSRSAVAFMRSISPAYRKVGRLRSLEAVR